MSETKLETDESLREKVLKGVEWLNANAPEDWKYRLFDEDFSFLRQLCMAETSILPLAFGDDLEIEHSTDIGICVHFNMTHEFRVSHGFFVDVCSELLIARLTRIWEIVLREKIEEEASGSLR